MDLANHKERDTIFQKLLSLCYIFSNDFQCFWRPWTNLATVSFQILNDLTQHGLKDMATQTSSSYDSFKAIVGRNVHGRIYFRGSSMFLIPYFL